MDDGKEEAIGSTEPTPMHNSAPNPYIDLQNLDPENNSQSSQTTYQKNMVQSSVGNSTTMELSSGKRARSPTDQPMQASQVNAVMNETSAGVKRMKLSHPRLTSRVPNCPICDMPHENGLSIVSMDASKDRNWGEIILNVFKPRDDAKRMISNVLLDSPKGPCVIFLESRDEACELMREFSTFTFRGDEFRLSFWYNKQDSDKRSKIVGNKSSSSTPASLTSHSSGDAQPKIETSEASISVETVQSKLQDAIPIAKQLQSRNRDIYQALAGGCGFHVLLPLNALHIPENMSPNEVRDQLRLVWFDILNSKCNCGLSKIYEVAGKVTQQRLRYFLVFSSSEQRDDCKKILSACKIKLQPESNTSVAIKITSQESDVGLKTQWSKISMEELRHAWSRLAPEAPPSPAQDVVQVVEPISEQATSALPLLNSLSTYEMELQTRYFGPGAGTDIARCYCCGTAGHLSEECPSRMCVHCGKVNVHFSNACPTYQRCFKCREVGHTSGDCTSKLKRSMAADGIVCQLCKADDHGEENCPTQWTTYQPQMHPDQIHLVRSLRCVCYQCGSDKHWGSDCKAMHAKRYAPRGPFSSAYASQFLLSGGDGHTGASIALESPAVDDDFSIMGRGQVEPTHAPSIRVSLPASVPGASQRPRPGPHGNPAESAYQAGMSGAPQHYYESPAAYPLAPASMPSYVAPVTFAPPYPVSMPPHLAPVSQPLHFAPAAMYPHGSQQAALPQPPLPNEPPPPFYFSFVDRGQ